jgi:hypothetical protein
MIKRNEISEITINMEDSMVIEKLSISVTPLTL